MEKCSYLKTKLQDKLLDNLYLPNEQILIEKKHIKYKNLPHSFKECKQDEKFIQNLNYKKITVKEKTSNDFNKELQTKIINTNKSNEPDEKKKTRIKTLQTQYKKKIDNIGNVLRSYKTKLTINSLQKNLIFGWFSECDYVYNKCVYLFNENPITFNNMSKSDFFNKIFGKTEKRCPYDILTDEFRIFKSNVKSSLKNIKNHNQTHFTMKNKSCKKGRSILIPQRSITKKGFFYALLGKIKDFKKCVNLKKVTCDCRLVYDKIEDIFYLYVPQYIQKKKIENRKEVVSLDPGERIFMTYYSLEEIGKIGEDLRKPILGEQKKIKRLQRIIKQGKNKNGKKLKNKKKLWRKINRIYKKITNRVKELHNQTAKYLCENYKRILIPEFKTKKMIKNEEGTVNEKRRKRRLDRRVKFVLGHLSHYKFRQHLLSKGEEYGCQVIVCTEENTSKCCGKCGYLSKKYEGRTKVCEKCGYKINRDVNGARNILVKNADKIFTQKASSKERKSLTSN